jgi:uncharacterized membrane protein
MKCLHVSLIILFLAGLGCSSGTASLKGIVTDAGSGKSLEGIEVEVFETGDYSAPVAAAKTDDMGCYEVTVGTGRYYDVYLRLGSVNPNQRTPEAVREGAAYTLNFNIIRESSYEGAAPERYASVMLIILAFSLILLAVYDRVFTEGRPKVSVDDLDRAKREVEDMIELSRQKYHRREIDEDGFREISKRQQERLIEIESKLKALGKN